MLFLTDAIAKQFEIKDRVTKLMKLDQGLQKKVKHLQVQYLTNKIRRLQDNKEDPENHYIVSTVEEFTSLSF